MAFLKRFGPSTVSLLIVAIAAAPFIPRRAPLTEEQQVERKREEVRLEATAAGERAARERERARADEGWRDQALVDAAKEGVRGVLKDPGSAEFSDLSVEKHTGKAVVCGRVNARNGFGGYGGWMRFVSGGSVGTTFVNEDTEGFAKVWNTMCVAAPPTTTASISKKADAKPKADANNIPIPSDAKARYTMLSLRNEGELVSVETRRDGPSGTSYARRLVDCRRMLSKYTATGDTQEDLKRSKPAEKMTPMVEGSISDVVSRFACAADASRSKAKK
ncbi:MAG: hypothetical protein ACKVP3_07980 [Hyphomicrobiaceae bacterium]